MCYSENDQNFPVEYKNDDDNHNNE